MGYKIKIDYKEIKKYYDDHPMGELGKYSTEGEILSRIDKITKSISTINPNSCLDIGCGIGNIGISAQKYAGHYTGLDLSQTAIKNAKQGFKGTSEFIVGDASDLPFKNESFDLVICSEVLEHIPNYSKVISEMSRVLKSKGYLIITMPNYYNLSILIRMLKNKKGTAQIYDKPIKYNSLINILRNDNFKVERINFFYFHLPMLPFSYNLKIKKLFTKNHLLDMFLRLYLFVQARKL